MEAAGNWLDKVTVTDSCCRCSGNSFSQITHIRRSVSLGSRNKGIWRRVKSVNLFGIPHSKSLLDKFPQGDSILEGVSHQLALTPDQTVLAVFLTVSRFSLARGQTILLCACPAVSRGIQDHDTCFVILIITIRSMPVDQGIKTRWW